MSKFEVINTKSDRVISVHDTLDAAIRAEARFLSAIKRSRGSGSTTIQCGGRRFEECIVSRQGGRIAARALLA